jgi:hypothetical protein
MSGKVVLTPFIFFALAAHAAFDANDIALGASERDILQKYPHANCRELEWPSRAAQRRCDDSRITFAGVDASVTFYLRADMVEGFDVRFDQREVERVAKFLRSRYGPPLVERSEPPISVEWKDKAERARLTAESGRRRASLLVWRGTFEEEIYKVR